MDFSLIVGVHFVPSGFLFVCFWRVWFCFLALGVRRRVDCFGFWPPTLDRRLVFLYLVAGAAFSVFPRFRGNHPFGEFFFSLFCISWVVSGPCFVMGFARTITLVVGRKLNGRSQEEKSKAIVDHFAPLKIESIQFCFELVRVTFDTEASKDRALQQKGFHIFGMWVRIEGGGPPLTNVHIFDYPFEGEKAPVAAALAPHGEVKEVRQQRYSFDPALYSGTRIVRMVLKGTPRGCCL